MLIRVMTCVAYQWEAAIFYTFVGDLVKMAQAIAKRTYVQIAMNAPETLVW